MRISGPLKLRIYKERINVFLSTAISLLLHAILILCWINYRNAPEKVVTVSVNIVTEEPPVELDEDTPDIEYDIKEETAEDTSTLMNNALSETHSPVTDPSELSIDQESVLTFDALPNKPPGFGIFGKNGSGLGEGVKVTTIGGNIIRAKNLGVIIDTSGSMNYLIESVKRQVEKEFPNAPTLMIEGCSLTTATVESMIDFVYAHKTDSLFWFCDLQDPVKLKAAETLQSYLTKNNVRFYIRTYDQPGTEAIQKLVEKTGGSIFLETGSLEWQEEDMELLLPGPQLQFD